MEKENHILTLLIENKKHSQNVEKGIKVDRSNRIKTEAKIQNVKRNVDEEDVEILGATLLSEDDYNKVPRKFRQPKPFLRSWTLRPSSKTPDLVPEWNEMWKKITHYYPNSYDILGYNSHNVRPVLILSDSSNFRVGDTFEFAGEPFVVIDNDKALSINTIGRCSYRKDWEAPDVADYEKSDIKKFVDNWFNQHKGEEIEVTESKKAVKESKKNIKTEAVEVYLSDEHTADDYGRYYGYCTVNHPTLGKFRFSVNETRVGEKPWGLDKLTSDQLAYIKSHKKDFINMYKKDIPHMTLDESKRKITEAPITGDRNNLGYNNEAKNIKAIL